MLTEMCIVIASLDLLSLRDRRFLSVVAISVSLSRGTRDGNLGLPALNLRRMKNSRSRECPQPVNPRLLHFARNDKVKETQPC
jgi:hypothetical protein